MSLATIYLIVIRLIHIFAAVTWVGGGIFVVSVLLPTVQEAGQDGGRFMLHFARVGGFTRLLASASGLTVVAGALLYWNDYILHTTLISTPSGIAFTIGSIVGIVAFIDGAFRTGRLGREMGAAAKVVLESKGPPPPELLQKAQALGARMASASMLSVTMAAVALFFMAVARYL